MTYLIDGHNLIPHLGIQLSSLDDELELVRILQEFCRLQRKRVEVYFDGAPPGHAGVKRYGSVTAHFVRQGQSADDAIRMRLKKLGRAARNWTVVSSDRQVQSEARSVHAQGLSSDEFARLVKTARQSQHDSSTSEEGLSPDEVDRWLDFFANQDKK